MCSCLPLVLRPSLLGHCLLSAFSILLRLRHSFPAAMATGRDEGQKCWYTVELWHYIMPSGKRQSLLKSREEQRGGPLSAGDGGVRKERWEELSNFQGTFESYKNVHRALPEITKECSCSTSMPPFGA